MKLPGPQIFFVRIFLTIVSIILILTGLLRLSSSFSQFYVSYIFVFVHFVCFQFYWNKTVFFLSPMKYMYILSFFHSLYYLSMSSFLYQSHQKSVHLLKVSKNFWLRYSLLCFISEFCDFCPYLYYFLFRFMMLSL